MWDDMTAHVGPPVVHESTPPDYKARMAELTEFCIAGQRYFSRQLAPTSDLEMAVEGLDNFKFTLGKMVEILDSRIND